MVACLILVALLQFSEANHFFGPPAVGFGVGLVSVAKNFPVATSIVSRRASRSYSHQYFIQATPHGTSGYSMRCCLNKILMGIRSRCPSTDNRSCNRKVFGHADKSNSKPNGRRSKEMVGL